MGRSNISEWIGHRVHGLAKRIERYIRPPYVHCIVVGRAKDQSLLGFSIAAIRPDLTGLIYPVGTDSSSRDSSCRVKARFAID